MADPNSSGTAYTLLATMVQLMGEDKGFDYLKKLHKNVNQYTKSGAAPAQAMAQGETLIGITFMHDIVTFAVQGRPVKVVAPCEGTGYEIGSQSIIKGGPNPENAKKWYDWALTPEAQALGAQAKALPGAVEQERARPGPGAEVHADQADQLRLRQVRLLGGAQAPALEVGHGGQGAPEVMPDGPSPAALRREPRAGESLPRDGPDRSARA